MNQRSKGRRTTITTATYYNVTSFEAMVCRENEAKGITGM